MEISVSHGVHEIIGTPQLTENEQKPMGRHTDDSVSYSNMSAWELKELFRLLTDEQNKYLSQIYVYIVVRSKATEKK